jgi:hypothetical protein
MASACSRRAINRPNELAVAINFQEPRFWIVSGLPTIHPESRVPSSLMMGEDMSVSRKDEAFYT